jgi:hypothetical protein
MIVSKLSQVWSDLFQDGIYLLHCQSAQTDDLDEDLDFTRTTREGLLDICEGELEDLPTPFEWKFR